MVDKKRRTRGEGALYQRADGKWVGTIDLGWHNGKRIRKSVSSVNLKDAQAKFRKLKSDTEKGMGTSGKDVSVEEWLTYWLENIVNERNKESTQEAYLTACRKWLIPYLGKYRLSKLNEDHLRSLYSTMKAQGLKDGSRRKVHMVLRRALVVAEREGRIPRNPAAMVDPPSTKVTHRTPLTVEQARQILSGLDEHPLAARWIACLLQGMRQGECLGLQWSDLDFENETITIRNQQYQSKSDGYVLTSPKSASSMRTIPMLSPMKFALENTEHRGDFVFYGVATDRRIDWKNWKLLLIETGVCDEEMPMGDMPELAAGRTTTGTLLRDAGVDVTIIRDILGHSQVQVTQESYQRTDAKAMKSAMQALETSIS